MRKSFNNRIEACEQAVHGLRQLQHEIESARHEIAKAINQGNRIYACGNGGSAAEASHFATELSGRYRSNRNAMSAIALTADGTAITCIGNDFGWDNIFARQVEAHGREGDVLVVLTTSGESPNIIAALIAAQKAGMKTIGLLGKGGGQAKQMCQIPIIVPSDDTGGIQEAHLVIIHILCEELEPEE